jgi:signal transduction histidine kinase
VTSALSFRGRILLIVLLLGVLPLGLLGLWTTGQTSRSGERLLRAQLEESLDQVVSSIVSRWYRLRSDILFLTELPTVTAALDEAPTNPLPPPTEFARLFEALDQSVTAAVVTDLQGTERWRIARPTSGDVLGEGFGATLPVTFAIRDKLDGRQLGSLTVELLGSSLLPPGGLAPPVAGTVLGLFGAGSELPLIPHPLENRLLAGPEFTSAGDRWLASERILTEPPMRVVVAAPMTPFVEPFKDAARQSMALLFIVTLGGLVLVAVLTSRLTRSLRALSVAAEAVSDGELDRRVEVSSEDEVGRVADAFNTMTENLDRTMRELARQESLAAVGQFAATLAHEVRNPLTAIRVDLQIAEDELPEGSAGRQAQERALHEVMRLNDTVSDTLRLARSPSGSSIVDLRRVLQDSVAAADPVFEQHAGRLDLNLGQDRLHLDGDAGALEQLFLNLLQNAAQALDTGGRASLNVELADEGDTVVVSIGDDGPGMTDEVLDQIFEPLFSTRPDGTGLGLTIARRIATAHGGELTLESAPGSGTVVRVSLPLAAQPDAAG